MIEEWLPKLIIIIKCMETLANWLFVSKTESANNYTFNACENKLYLKENSALKKSQTANITQKYFQHI